MARRSTIAGAMVFALAMLPSTWAQAQWGYPGGYGGYGWGGWGASTAQGDIARGMGVYAAGAGYYNQQTAVANSINADTVMRWNTYVYESQKEANRNYHARLAGDRAQTNKAADEIRDRLRNRPTRNDIYRGDAMNVALDEINDPRVYTKALQGAQDKVGGDAIRNIPFQYAAAAVTISVHQLLKGGPPAALLKPEFEPERTALRELRGELKNQIETTGHAEPATVQKALEMINKAEAKADTILKANSRDRIEADRFLKAAHGLIAMLDTPAIDVLLSGVEKRPDASLGELLTFMNAFNLRFGVASTQQQRAVYDTIFPRLVALRDQVAPALATSAPTTTSGTEAGEFFSGMSYQDLQKKAPAPIKP